MDKKNQVLMSVLGVFALVIVTVGVSYAFFSYTRTGTTTSTITSGNISFSYIEGDSATLENAFPVADEIGAAEDDPNKVYTFDVSTTYDGTDIAMAYNVSFVKNNDPAATTQVKKYIFGPGGVVERDEDGNPKYELVSGTASYFQDSEVKYQLQRKATGESDYSVVAGYGMAGQTGLLSAVFNGADEGTVLQNQAITSGVHHEYELRLWLNGEGEGDVDYSNTTRTDDYTTEYEDAQISAGGYNGKSYSIKVKVDAAATNNYGVTSS